MTTASAIQNRTTHVELERMVELLANYICASEQPGTTLATAVARLQREVRDTHQEALRHLQVRSSMPM
jgi:hypothetical protein